ncbi:hypothetical protein T03_5853 [Trichinella britovi]|uniref:MULE transposase domain-containing protein n=1 Tax=Trichinella britovi TaxID=45882 RepID=A0A0V1D0K5_TRIBR|nr:hypothetical protein T03_5853 [Trichinella britovi]
MLLATAFLPLLSRNPAAGSIRQISNRYAEKQRRVMMYRGECISDRRTVKQFLQDLMYPQLFSIHAFSAGKLVPAICLCTNKDIGTYEFIFEALISRTAALKVDLNPDTIIYSPDTCDLGLLSESAGTVLQFHVCQAVHWKISELGLKTRYRHDEETRRKIKMLLATAFLPLLSRNPAAGSIRQISNRYAEKQRRVMMYRGECISDRRTVKQFLQDLMYLMTEPI